MGRKRRRKALPPDTAPPWTCDTSSDGAARRLQVGAHRRRNRPLRRRGTHQGHLWRTDKIYSCGKHPSLTCIKLSWANCGDPALPCTTDKSDAAARAIDVSRQNDVNTLPWLDHPSLQEITACAHGERRDDSDCALAALAPAAHSRRAVLYTSPSPRDR